MDVDPGGGDRLSTRAQHLRRLRSRGWKECWRRSSDCGGEGEGFGGGGVKEVAEEEVEQVVEETADLVCRVRDGVVAAVVSRLLDGRRHITAQTAYGSWRILLVL